LAVAASLHARNGIAIEKSLALWETYNRLLLDYQRQWDFPMVSFDWPPERYGQRLRTLAAALNLTVPPAGFSFFESALRKNSVPEETTRPLLTRLLALLGRTPASTDSTVLPKPVVALYRQLQETAA
jgi:hypothetical protein